ncbi:MAG TPA: hypothetical protein VH165_03405 [Kofleriaceae bacterium]|jgi:hypothetical protein|nr:hypothetical protein [Kofleriaceae bacterium]
MTDTLYKTSTLFTARSAASPNARAAPRIADERVFHSLAGRYRPAKRGSTT